MTFNWSEEPGPHNEWRLFDEWRAQYDTMSLHDQQEFHTEFYKRWSVVHQHGDDRPAVVFFDRIGEQPVRVLEIGGWTGEVASDFLRTHPNIEHWTNIEICREAVRDSKPKDPRYEAVVPTSWPWDSNHPSYNVLFMQHVVEHMRYTEFTALLDAVPDAEWVFIQSPLDMEPRSWKGYPGCHILEVGWNQIDEAMAERGFELQTSWWDTIYSTAPENGRTRIYRREP